MLSNNFDFDFNEVIIDDKKVIVLTSSSASLYPAAFKKESYVRIGSYMGWGAKSGLVKPVR